MPQNGIFTKTSIKSGVSSGLYLGNDGALLNSAGGKYSSLNLVSIPSYSAVTATGITSATYTSSTGVIALTFGTAPFGASIGQACLGVPLVIGGITSSVSANSASMNGTFPLIATGTSGTVVSVQGPIGLGVNTLTTTNGTLAAGGGATTTLIKASAGRAGRLLINAAGTAGSWTVYDSATALGANYSNTVWNAAYGATSVAAGSVVTIDFPCLNGIVITVPVTGSAAFSWV